MPNERYEMMTPMQQQMCRPFFEAVKQGEIEQVLDFAKRVDISTLTTDGPGFYQNALYSAA